MGSPSTRGDLLKSPVLPIVGAVLIVSLGASASAQAASTHAEYIAQVDPICQANAAAVNGSLAAYNKNYNRLIRTAKSGTLKAFVKQNGRTARALSRAAATRSTMTEQIAAVVPAAADTSVIGNWIARQREEEAFAASAAAALKKFQSKAFFARIDKTQAAHDAARQTISGFGFQVCGVSV